MPNIGLVEREDGRWELVVGTSSNHVYRIKFLPYFLKRDKTLWVEQPQRLELPGVLQAIEVGTDADTGATVLVYGMALSPEVEPEVGDDVGQTLHLDYENVGQVNLSKYPKGMISSGIGLVGKGLGGLGGLATAATSKVRGAF